MTEREEFEVWLIANKSVTKIYAAYAWEGWQAARRTVSDAQAHALSELPPAMWSCGGVGLFTEHQMQGYANAALAHGAQAECAASDASAQEPVLTIRLNEFLDYEFVGGSLGNLGPGEHKLYTEPRTTPRMWIETGDFGSDEPPRIVVEQAECGKSSGEAVKPVLSTEVCAQDVFEKGQSIGLFDIPKHTANEICAGISAATGARVDWHYIGGRVHMKALAATPASPAPQHSADIDAMRLSDERILEIARLHRGNHDWEAFSHFSQIGLLAFVRAIQEEQGK
jgi:hypothetical protein